MGVSQAALAFMAMVEPWNYAQVAEAYVAPMCPCCRKPIAKGVSRIKVHRETLHHACYMYDPN